MLVITCKGTIAGMMAVLSQVLPSDLLVIYKVQHTAKDSAKGKHHFLGMPLLIHVIARVYLQHCDSHAHAVPLSFPLR